MRGTLSSPVAGTLVVIAVALAASAFFLILAASDAYVVLTQLSG